MGLGQYNGQGVYCGLSTASEVFLIFTTQLYQFSSVIFLFALSSDKPEVFLSKYSQAAIPHAAHFWRVVKALTGQFKSNRPGVFLLVSYTHTGHPLW